MTMNWKKLLLIALVISGFAFAPAPSSNGGVSVGIGVGFPVAYGYPYGYGYRPILTTMVQAFTLDQDSIGPAGIAIITAAIAISPPLDYRGY